MIGAAGQHLRPCSSSGSNAAHSVFNMINILLFLVVVFFPQFPNIEYYSSLSKNVQPLKLQGVGFKCCSGSYKGFKQKDGGRWMRKECKDKSDESVGPLTVEGLGAHLAVSFGHSTATTRRSGRVTLHALHRLACTSGRQCRNTLWKTPALINTKSAKIAAIYIYIEI